MKRCKWAVHPLSIKYHDERWCKITHDDKELFRMLILEGLQAGLSWDIVLKKEAAYDEAIDHFDYDKIAKYNEDKINELLNNKELIRNKRKMNAIVKNAKAFIEVIHEYGSFDKYIWSYVNNQPIIHHYHDINEVPPFDELSTMISKDLKKKDFTFVGPTIIYSYLQAIGIYNDHEEDCDFKYFS